MLVSVWGGLWTHRATGTADLQTQWSLGCSSPPCEQVLPPRCSPWSLCREGTLGRALCLGPHRPLCTPKCADALSWQRGRGRERRTLRGRSWPDPEVAPRVCSLLRPQPPCTGRKPCPQACSPLALVLPSAQPSPAPTMRFLVCRGGCACPWPALWGSYGVPSRPQGACGWGGRKDSKDGRAQCSPPPGPGGRREGRREAAQPGGHGDGAWAGQGSCGAPRIVQSSRAGSRAERGHSGGKTSTDGPWHGPWEGKQDELPISQANTKGPGKRGDGRLKHILETAVAARPPSSKPPTCSLSFQECPVRGGSCQRGWTGAQERGPRQVAGSSDTFLAEVCVPGGRCCEAVVGLCIWGCGRASRPLARLSSSHSRA